MIDNIIISIENCDIDLGILDVKRLHNISVWHKADGLNCGNSISRFYFGNNIRAFKSVNELESCFVKLADALTIPYEVLIKSNLKRFDVNVNFYLNESVKAIISNIGMFAGKSIKSTFKDETATFDLKTEKEFSFYDKKTEIKHQLRKARQRRQTDEIQIISRILKHLETKEILRIEQRYKTKRVIEQSFGKLILKDLLNIQLWENIKTKFLEKFETINLVELPKFELTAKNIDAYIYEVGIQTIGAEKIESVIKQEQNPQRRYLLRKKFIKEQKKIESIATDKPLKLEMERGIQKIFDKFIMESKNGI